MNNPADAFNQLVSLLFKQMTQKQLLGCRENANVGKRWRKALVFASEQASKGIHQKCPYNKAWTIPMVTLRAEGSSDVQVSNLCSDFSP